MELSTPGSAVHYWDKSTVMRTPSCSAGVRDRGPRPSVGRVRAQASEQSATKEVPDCHRAHSRTWTFLSSVEVSLSIGNPNRNLPFCQLLAGHSALKRKAELESDLGMDIDIEPSMAQLAHCHTGVCL